MFFVEFPQVQYIDLSEIVHVLKAVAMMTIENLNLSTMFVDSYFLSAKVSPEWRLNQGFGTQRSCFFFPLNRRVPSIEVTNTKIMWTFSGSKFCVPWMVASLE